MGFQRYSRTRSLKASPRVEVLSLGTSDYDSEGFTDVEDEASTRRVVSSRPKDATTITFSENCRMLNDVPSAIDPLVIEEIAHDDEPDVIRLLGHVDVLGCLDPALYFDRDVWSGPHPVHSGGVARNIHWGVVSPIYPQVSDQPFQSFCLPRGMASEAQAPRIFGTIDTVCAALAVDYPSHLYRVVVCDDGDSKNLAAWVTSLAQQRSNLHYTARTRHGPEGYKAGNLNHGLGFVDALPGGPAEYVAGIDADMIVERRWLRSVMAHIAPDPDMGMACPAQVRTPKLKTINDPLSQSNRQSWRLSNVVRDMADIAWNTGSGWVARRQAIDDIGGFPTGCLIEDIHSSTLLLTLGWKTAYVAEALQYGLVPETYDGHVKQFTRWRVLDFDQAVASVFGPFTSVVGLVFTVLFLFSNIHLAYFMNLDQLRLLLRLQTCATLLQAVSTCLSSFLVGYETAIRQDPAWMGSFTPALTQTLRKDYIASVMRSFVLNPFLGGRAASFTPSGTISNNIRERDHHRRAPIHRRLWHMMAHCGAWFHVIVVTLLVAGVACRVAGHPLITIIPTNPRALLVQQSSTVGEDNVPEAWIGLLERIAWPPLGWLTGIMSWSTPIRYALFPPRVPDREELLGDRDEKGARYPADSVKGCKWSLWGFGETHVYILGVGYSAGLLIWSFWI
ncbi:Uu.00g121390.m01.CDS01 [Anthostomella pinea]|uniref:Uu.00g121390.m01.CDS01 n=1 Tax=Anthostomella pinea TaxID=933095 RepID=A0AAI8VH00_9PEZI|nr:Uu.00g121390.m01.CDS01 [Anthostomella pinea]